MENKMNIKHIFIIIFIPSIIVFLSCRKNFSPIEDDIQKSKDIISLNVGNKYFFRASIIDGQYFTDWFFSRSIKNEETIGGIKYFNYSDEYYIRIDNNKVIKYSNGKESVLFDYSVNKGDSLLFENRTLIVDSITVKSLFNSPTLETVIKATNKSFNPHTIISISYATKFGLIGYAEYRNNRTEGYYLMGAILDNKMYGNRF